MTLLLAMAGPALAGAFTAAPVVDVVGGPDIGLRPGLTLGYEPAPAAAVELHGDSSLDGHWDAGLALAGRWWISPAEYAGEGLFLVGRFTAGLSGDAYDIGPWTGFGFGFGVRPVSALHIEASAGPEWVIGGPARWRTGLSIGGVLDLSSIGGGSVRHHPRKIPEG